MTQLRTHPPPADVSVERSSTERRLVLGGFAAVAVPIVVAAIRALARGWTPLGDNAFFALRAGDVFSGHLPLLGTWSSSSLVMGVNVNNPGPLFFYALAVPVELFGSRVGSALGVVVFNVAAVAGIAYVAWRRVGAIGAALALAVAACVCWSMGSELLFEPWQPHSLLLPFLLVLMLAWSVSCGDLAALPWLAGLASIVLQTHLSYGLLIPAVSAWAVIGLVVSLRRARDDRTDVESWARLRQRVLRTGIVTVIVVVLCWLPSIVEQFTSTGDGNLTRLARGLRASDVTTPGLSLGARVFASVIALPPWWLRPSFSDTLTFGGGHLASSAVAAAALIVVAVLVVACLWWARRRGDGVCARALVTASVALVAGLVTIVRSPETVFGGVAPHTVRWLWPLGGFLTFALGVTVLRAVATAHRTATVAGLTTVTVLLGLLTLPTYRITVDPGSLPKGSGLYAAVRTGDALNSSFEPARKVARQLGSLEDGGPYLVDGFFSGVFDPYGSALMVELQRRGIEFVARDPGLVRQIGSDRKFNGHNARAELFLRSGDAVHDPPAGARRVALAVGLTAPEQRERSRLDRRVRDRLEVDASRFERSGALDGLPVLRRQLRAGDVDPAELSRFGELTAIADRHLLGDERADDALRRYDELQRRYQEGTLAVYERPRRAGGAAS